MKGSSILARLGIRSRVLLRDIGREDSPVLRVSSAPGAPSASMSERYQIVGEIARGGIGVILKGRDVDLGRDVAMKMLRPEHTSNTDLVGRFIEEAQIEGQLQHPGIVPVYELGLREQQPYFTMKLVKGRTLAALLAARASPAEDRRRFLAILHKVSEAVAYAHARGVVHRDLKPSNVMVGAFGEVLVVDWGFAKVLSQEELPREAAESVVRTTRAASGSQSIAGSVVGTPAYMSPEQALGEAATLDARADVFALGAILCEILTGRPPYGGGGSDPLLQASRAEIEGAFARLDACGAEAELVRIAKDCLAPARGERPADGGAVAQRVGAHLAAVEERARRAEVDAAEATVRAKGERRGRRLTLALASAVVLALLVGGGAWWRLESQASEVREKRAGRVRAALAEAGERRGEALRLGVEGWEGASGAARAAAELARAPETPPFLRQEAERFAARVEEEADAARAEADRARIESETVERLAQIRNRGGDTFNRFQSDEDFAAAFVACVGDVMDLAPEEAAARIRASRIAAEICAALDDWAALETAPRDHLRAILRLADPDPWRGEVRAAAAARDLERLRALAASADPASQPATSLTLLASAMAASIAWKEEASDLQTLARKTEARVEETVALLRRSFPYHPDDVWIHLMLAQWLSSGLVNDFEAAIVHFRAALALRPASTEVRHFLGIALDAAGHHDEAIEVWSDALAIDPTFIHLHEHLFLAEKRRGTLSRRATEIQEAIRQRPADAKLHFELGHALRLMWDWPGAAASFQRAVDLDPAPGVQTRLYCALALANAGRVNEARRARATIEEMMAAQPRAQQPCSTWIMLATLRERTGDPEGAVEAYHVAIDILPAWGNNSNWLAETLARKGDIDEAVLACRESLRLGGPTPAVDDVAAALTGAGRQEEAVEFCRQAAPLLRKEIERGRGHGLLPHWTLGTILYAYLGDYDGAHEVFREGVEADPLDMNCRVGIGIALASKPDPAAAAAAFEEFLTRYPDGPRAHLFLGNALRDLGRAEDALLQYREARRLGCPPSDRLEVNLGWLLLGLGEAEEGLDCLGRFAAQRGVPEGKWAPFAATLARAAPKLPAAVAGEPVPANPRELLALARMCAGRSLFARATALYRQALARDPSIAFDEVPLSGWRWSSLAAAAAVHAGTGRGTDAPSVGTDLRGQGLRWLRLELDDRRARFESDRGSREALRTALWAWKWAPAFAPVRYGPNLAQLPEAERESWQAFWRDIDAVLASTLP